MQGEQGLAHTRAFADSVVRDSMNAAGTMQKPLDSPYSADDGIDFWEPVSAVSAENAQVWCEVQSVTTACLQATIQAWHEAAQGKDLSLVKFDQSGPALRHSTSFIVS